MPKPTLYLMRLNDWEESVSRSNMDQAGPLPHSTAHIDLISGCRLHDLQPQSIAKMARTGLTLQQFAPLGNSSRSGHAHIIKRVSIQGPTITLSFILMCSIHGCGWCSQSFGLKLKNSAHCSRTSQSLGAINNEAALIVTPYWRGSGGLSTYATIVDQSHFV